MSNTHEITLDYPVTAKGQTYTTLSVRRAKTKDLKHLAGPNVANDPVGAQNRFHAALCEVPVEVFDEMDTADALKFAKYTESFSSAEN